LGLDVTEAVRRGSRSSPPAERPENTEKGVEMKNNWMIALIVGATVFAAVYAAASSLTLNSSNLQAASTSVGSCQTGALTTSFNVAYSQTLPGYRVSKAVVTGVDDTACDGKTLTEQLSDSADATVGSELSGTIVDQGGSPTFPRSCGTGCSETSLGTYEFSYGAAGPAAAAVAKVNAVING
jgi:hypothetical protein